MDSRHIRNFVIIAHIDHGKSTLADRMLEVTGTVEARRMKAQYLDQMDLERERGITIKMAPVRMKYRHADNEYVFNLIDTPGHSDFGYEVSRALRAVEGAILLVDATKGIQAQTLSNLRQARLAGLTIIGAVNKVDMPISNVEQVVADVARLLECDPAEVHRISAKTGLGVEDLLHDIVSRIPAPRPSEGAGLRAMVFDSQYDDHRGILAYVRVFDGVVDSGALMHCLATDASCKAKEAGYFSPQLTAAPQLESGMIGYIATGLKEPSMVKIGDTIVREGEKAQPFPGYREPAPVVFISLYPDGATKFEDLYKALDKLRLNDAAISFEPDANEALGRGLKVGFLGQLHFEIVSDRLRREFGLEFVTSFPSIAYRVKHEGQEWLARHPDEWPAKPDLVMQPMIKMQILTPPERMSDVLALAPVFEMQIQEMETVGTTLIITARMPLAELIRDFDDQLKSASAGYASFSYEFDGEEQARVAKLEILLAGDVESALTRIVSLKDVEREARASVERLKKLLPALPFAQAIQAQVDGRILARETIAALKKDVTGYLYGGDRSRKMKLWKKQKEGKKRLQERGKVQIPPDVFREILKK